MIFSVREESKKVVIYLFSMLARSTTTKAAFYTKTTSFYEYQIVFACRTKVLFFFFLYYLWLMSYFFSRYIIGHVNGFGNCISYPVLPNCLSTKMISPMDVHCSNEDLLHPFWNFRNTSSRTIVICNFCK